MKHVKLTTTRKIQFPHTFIIIFFFILLATALTWIIPSGEYDFVAGGARKRILDAESFHYVTDKSVSFLLIPSYIIRAFSSRSDLIALIFSAGSAFYVAVKNGALQEILQLGARKFSRKIYTFIPVLMLIFALICTTQGVNMLIPFAPMMVIFALSLGLDSISGAAILLLGGAIGFSTGTLNMYTTVVAQQIAGLPLYSGLEYRIFCFFVFYVVTAAYFLQYIRKIRKNPEKSYVYDLDLNVRRQLDQREKTGTDNLTVQKISPLLLLVVMFIVLVYGIASLHWKVNEIAAVFLTYAVTADLLSGTDANEMCRDIINGAKNMMAPALIIAMGSSISSILKDGQILYTIVHGLYLVLEKMPAEVIAPGMVIVNAVINVFLVSGSGQAMVVMPIMIPLADALGVTRQTAVLAFNFGDGFCNYILPTSTALMGILSVTNIPYDRWMRFMWKLFLLWLATACLLCFFAQKLHLGPM